MQTPNFTPAQILGALIGAIYPILTLLGIDLSAEQKDALEELIFLGGSLIGGDALIRFGRSRRLLHPPQNITVLDPNAAGIENIPPRQDIHDLHDQEVDTPIDDPAGSSGAPPPQGL